MLDKVEKVRNKNDEFPRMKKPEATGDVAGGIEAVAACGPFSEPNGAG